MTVSTFLGGIIAILIFEGIILTIIAIIADSFLDESITSRIVIYCAIILMIITIIGVIIFLKSHHIS